ncbi:hypothetical protein PJ985_22755 [Streptomyces sp. ACA25]|uniref:hypothetical protein n=1 Tax=Streptomyces sp. ACA25 TaxID=3022596 RepID=UPI002306F2DC|nr:hypothetical protein [Streptomyces sp. ACA25]MDB1090373.1 hypothetical protein [Streptomyces sp. ACA25]
MTRLSPALARLPGAGSAVPAALVLVLPLAVVCRGLLRLGRAGREAWSRVPHERRGPAALLLVTGSALVGMAPHGVPLAALALLAAAAVRGREAAAPTRAERKAQLRRAEEARTRRLQTVHEALVPHFSRPGAPTLDPLPACGDDWQRTVVKHAFTADGRIARLRLHYPAHFPDSDAAARAGVQDVLAAKAGRDREFRFRWDQECNQVDMRALAPLPTGICAQRFVTAPGEVLLGFTDADSVDRTVPVRETGTGAVTSEAAPVVWRTGARSAQPHLLVVGRPGAGTTSLLRSVVLQGLQHGEAVLIDGSGAGEFACFAGRQGVLATESAPSGALAVLEWAAHETERRLAAVARARRTGVTGAGARPLWLVLDRPSQLIRPAGKERLAAVQELLGVVLRLGRAGGVRVVLAEHFEALDTLSGTVREYAHARIVLGTAPAPRLRAVLGELPDSTPAPEMPPGRGYCRLGPGPVLRLQAPATPDPGDDSADGREREAVLALLPGPVLPLERRTASRSGADASGSGATDQVM